MAFNTAEGRAEYTASSGQTAFSFVFKIYANSDIKVYQTPNGSVANDTADLLTITTDYTVTIDGDNGGTVTLTSGATAGDTIVLARNLAATRTVDYQNNGDFNADTIDNDQNYQTYLIVDGYTRLARALLMPESLVGVSTDIPSSIADSYIKWNATADALENDTTIPDNVTLSQTAATTATTQAGIATTQAGLSATSETNSQLRAWEAEAEKMTADSYATEAEDVFVKSYASDGDGTFTATDTTEYSALHWSIKALANSNFAGAINAAPAKTTPVDADKIGIWDSVSGLLRSVTGTDWKAYFKSYFDTIYSPIASPAFTGPVSVESSIIFEGSTPDAFETTLTVIEPTADNTVTIPNRTFTIAGTDDISNYLYAPEGSIIQTQSNNTSTVATGTTTIPFDNTAPQITEGTQFLSYVFVPKQTTGVIIIHVSVYASLTIAGHIIVAVFDGSANAIAVRDVTVTSTNETQPITFSFPYSFVTASSKTFSVRIGGNGASTVTFNGSNSAGLYGGTINSSLIMQEVKV